MKQSEIVLNLPEFEAPNFTIPNTHQLAHH